MELTFSFLLVFRLSLHAVYYAKNEERHLVVSMFLDVRPFGYVFRGTQQESLRKRPKNNNEAWIKLSEAILSILRDCWEKFICSSLLARLLEEFPASKVHMQPVQPDLLGGFPADVCPHITGQFRCGHRGGGGGGLLIGYCVWPTGEIHHFSGGGRRGREVAAIF